MKKILAALAAAALIGTASAKVYLGVPSSTLITSEGVATLIGLQFGSHEVMPNLGVRGYFEIDPAFSGALLQGGADVFYTAGGLSKFYIGGGAGVATINVTGANGVLPYIDPVIGADFDAGSVISYFIEASPRLYVGNGTAAIFYLRSGLNFHLDAKSPEYIYRSAEPTPEVVDVYSGAKYPAGTTIDEDGNLWIPSGAQP